MTILGIALILVGFGFLLLGFAGAAKEIFGRSSTGGNEEVSIPDLTDLAKALKELVAALAAAPQWLALTLIGSALVAAGGYLIGLPVPAPR